MSEEATRAPFWKRWLAGICRTYRSDPVLFLCFVVLTIAVAWPFWTSELLPFLDIPQHLATIAVMHHLDDPDFGYQAYFVVEAGSTQYLLYYLTCDLLSTFAGVETANRIFLTAYAVLLPLSVLFFLASFRRLRLGALLAYPLVFNAFLFYGFVNYLFAFPFMFFGLGLCRRALEAGRTCWWREGALVACSILCFYSHLQVFFVHAGGLGLVVLFAWPGWQRFLARLAHLAPVMVLFAVWLFGTRGMAGGEAWETSVSKRYESLTGAQWEPLLSSLRGVADRLMSVYETDKDERITVIWGVCLLVLLLLRRAGQQPEKSRRELLSSLSPEILTIFVVAFCFVVPTSYKWIWPVNWRFVPLAALLLLAWGRADLGFFASRVLTVVFAAFALWSISVHARHFRAFDEEASDVLPVLSQIPERARLMTLVFDSGSRVVSGPVYLHFGQYHQLRKGGVAVYSFAEAPQSPIRFRPQHQGGPPPTPLRSEWKPHEFRFDNNGRFYDYFLVRDDPKRRHFSFRGSGFDPREVQKVVESGPWALYRFVRGS